MMKKILLSLLVFTLFVFQSVKAQSNATLAADIILGMDASMPSYLTSYSGNLYFAANENTPSPDNELWRYNGTTATKISNINTSGPSFIASLIVFNNKLYFTADDGTNFGSELYAYDGTNPPSLVADINVGINSSFISSLAVFNSKLYFNADNGSGSSLWQYDGTNPPSIVAGGAGIQPLGFTVYNNVLYFKATDVTNGDEVWKYDGTNPPSMVQDIRAGSIGSFPMNFIVYNGNLYFNADDGVAGGELWKYNGTTATLAADIQTGSSTSNPNEFAVFNNKLYFAADNGTNGSELWQFDGTTASMAYDINSPGGPFDGSIPSKLFVYGDTLYFNATNGTNGVEIWKLGFTGAPVMQDLNPGPDPSFFDYPAIYNNKLYFSADNGSSGPELYYISNVCDATATLSGGASVCQNATAPIITFTGSNSVSPYTFSYTINGGSVQTITTAGTIATLSVPTATAGVYSYTLVSVAANGCSIGQSGSAIVTVNTMPTASLSGGATVCQNATAPILTFTGANATAPYTFSYRINGGAIQTLTTAGTVATLSASTATAGVFSYTLVSVASNGCSQAQSGLAIVTVNSSPTASISGTTSTCQLSTNPIITFSGANGIAPYNFTYRINGGSIQTITTTSGDDVTLSVSAATAGVYSYTLESVYTSACSQAQSGNAVITINSNPTATITGTTAVCQGATSPILTFTTTGGTNPFTLYYKINTDPTTSLTIATGNIATISAPTTTDGIFTYTLQAVEDNNGCGNFLTSVATVTVNPKPVVNLGPDVYLLTPSTQTFNAKNVGSTYAWSTGSTAQIISATAFGSYTVAVTNRFGCVGKDTINMVFNGPSTIFVNDNASGANNGTSWANAYTNLATAINNARNSDSIFVAAGTYQPASGQSFSMKENVKIYGGFAGTESFVHQRNLAANNISTLQGNSGNVVQNINNNLSDKAVLDGFTITGGNGAYGGGIYNKFSSPTIINCIIKGNVAAYRGGGISGQGSNSKIINCIIYQNDAGQNGGGIHVDSGSNFLVSNCSIISNTSASVGNGIYNDFSSKLVLYNSVVYHNTMNDDSYNFTRTTIKYCLMQGMGADATNHNIDGTQTLDLFVDAANGNYRLKPTAIAVNAGSNALVSTYTTKDLAGNSRVFQGNVDMGAYELQTAAVLLSDIICVTHNGAGLKNGDGWANAYDRFQLQTAINAAPVGKIIAVAAGTYTPNAGTSFSMKQGVSMYGGFEGTETHINQRDLNAGHTTVLKGNGKSVIHNNNNGITNATVLDGFSITGGSGSLSPIPAFGTTAFSLIQGGGIMNFQSSPTIKNCNIVGNNANAGGGIAYGYLVNVSGSINIINTKIHNNTTTGPGGGLYLLASHGTIINSSISANQAGHGGGISLAASKTDIINCSIGGNQVTGSGSGINSQMSAGETYALKNCIVYSNVPANSTISYFMEGESVISNSLVQGLGADATKGNPSGTTNIQNVFTNAAAGDLTLDIGALFTGPWQGGSNTALPSHITTDLAGNDRITYGVVDMGCYEASSQKATNITVSNNPLWIIKNSRNILSDLQLSNPEQKDLQTHFSLLQKAIDAAFPGDSIYVEKGIYTPGIDSAFVMKEGVHIFGGFNGTETSFAERDLNAGHTTILRGNGTSVIINDDNGLTNLAELNGFTLENGTGKDVDGITYGGAIYNYKASPTISNCIIKNNTADYGAGVFNDDNSSPNIVRCQILNNNALGDGAAVYSNYSSSAKITNSLLKGNTAGNDGGAVYANFMSDNKITNSTIVNNNASFDGGAIVANSSAVSMANSIVLNNTASSNAGVYAYNAGATNITYSLTQGITTGTGNLNGATTYTLFVNEAANNYRLKCGVAVIDAGRNDSIPSTGKIDLAQNSRTYDGTVDLGAYEYGAFSRPKAARRQTICSNDDIVFKSFISDATGATYQWMKAPNGSNTFTAIATAIKDSLLLSAVAQADSGSRYFVQITNGCGILHSDTMTLKVNRLPIVNFGADKAVCLNENFALEANNYGTMLWNDGSNNASLPTLISDKYWLELTDMNGCVASDTINIVVNTVDTVVTVNLSTLTVSHAGASSYQWIKSDGVGSYTIVSGATSQSFTATQDGSYAVIVNTVEGCSDTSAYKTIVNASVNENTKVNSSLKVYPNPTNGELTISSSEVIQQIEITDVMGRLVYTEKPIATKHTLNLITEPKGIYFVKVSSKQGTDVIKIIKQ